MSNFFLLNKEFEDDLKKYKIDDGMAVFHGFISALLSKGIDANDKVILDLVKSVLNFDSPLPGSIIAHITAYEIKAQKALKDKNYEPLLPGLDDDPVLTLGYLAQFGYGLTLGLLHMPGANGKISAHDKDSFDLFTALSELDESSEFDPESFTQVQKALCDGILELQQGRALRSDS